MYAGGWGIILVNIMELEKIYKTMMKTVDSARQNAGVNRLAKQLQSKDEYMAMYARTKLSKICQDVAKNTLNNLHIDHSCPLLILFYCRTDKYDSKHKLK